MDITDRFSVILYKGDSFVVSVLLSYTPMSSKWFYFIRNEFAPVWSTLFSFRVAPFSETDKTHLTHFVSSGRYPFSLIETKVWTKYWSPLFKASLA